jgi:hypothetical protein
MILLALRIDGD